MAIQSAGISRQTFPYRVTGLHKGQVLGEFLLERDAIMFGYIQAKEIAITVWNNDNLMIQLNEDEKDDIFVNSEFDPDTKVIKDGKHIATITNDFEAIFFYRDTANYIAEGPHGPFQLIIKQTTTEDDDEFIEYKYDDVDEWKEAIPYDDDDLSEADKFYREFIANERNTCVT